MALALVSPPGRALAAGEPLLSQPTPALRRALAVARAERSLQLARKDYTKSSFAACVGRLRRAERQLRTQLRTPEDLHLIKRLNQWIGLCLAVSSQRPAARLAFRRAARLPGPEIESDILPPVVADEMRRAARTPAQGWCRPQLSAGRDTVRVNGRLYRPGAEVDFGEIYVMWHGTGSGSDRLTLAADCTLTLPQQPPAAGPVTLSAQEARSERFLARLCRIAGVSSVAFEGGGGGRRVFDARSGSFTALPLAPAPPASQPLAVVPPPATIGAGPRWYQRWWVWAAVGAVVTAAVVVPLTVPRRTAYDIAF